MVGGQQKNQSYRGVYKYCGIEHFLYNFIKKEAIKYEKEEALKIILECSKLYYLNLENKNIMYIIQDKKKDIHYLETVFLPSNFLHLTGINITNKNIKSSTEFYNLCLKNQLSVSDFEFNSNGTTSMKLKILPQITKIQKVSKMIGRYNNTKLYLSTEKIVGNINICLGLIKKGKYYIPNTALKEDIRDITTEQEKVLAIFTKDIKEKEYKNLTYIKKDIDFKKNFRE